MVVLVFKLKRGAAVIKISGLDTLTKQLDEAQAALAELDEELGVVSFDPTDPASIEAAIQEAEGLVDERMAPYANNAIIGPLAEQMKNRYRDAVIAKAAESRSGGNV